MPVLRFLYTIYAYIVGVPIFLGFNIFTAPAVFFSSVRGPSYYYVGKFWSILLYFAFGIRTDIRGQENLIQDRGCLVVINHQSLIDIPLLFKILPTSFGIMFKKELLDVPLFGWHLRHAEHFCIDRGSGKSIREQEAELEHHLAMGLHIVVFVEGTRSRDGKLQPFKRGAFQLALKMGAPIIPVRIEGTFNFKAKAGRTAWPTRVQVRVGKRIDVTKMAEDDPGLRTASVRLTEQAQLAVKNLIPEGT